MIFVAAISISLFNSALLLAKKEKSRSDWVLFSWVLINAAHLSFFYLMQTGKIYEFPFLLGFQFPLPLLHGVMLFLYVSSVTNFYPKKRTLALLHFLPSLATLIYLIPFIMLPSEQKIEVFKNEGKGYEVFQFVVLLGVFVSGVIYVFFSNRLLLKHKKKIRNQFSDLEKINLKWLQFLTYGLGIVWFLVIFTRNDVLIFSAVSIFVILIGFFGLQQEDIFSSTKDNDIETQGLTMESLQNEVSIQKEEEKGKYNSSGLSDEKANLLHAQLSLAMEEDKVYTNSKLSLSELADKLNTPANYLSQILNEKEEQNFYDYVNTFRVNEFKRLISIPKNQNLTLLAVAYDCGFNSKSSFNRYFKKCTGQTPSQYLKTIKSEA